MAQPWGAIKIDADVCGKSNRLRVVAFLLLEITGKCVGAAFFGCRRLEHGEEVIRSV